MKRNEKSEGDGVATAVYKVNLHCLQCAREVEKPLLRTQGVWKVDVDIEHDEIKVTGKVDVKKIHKQIEKISEKMDQILSPKDIIAAKKEKKKKDTKEPILSKTTVKIHLHCEKCEYDLKRRILKLKGVYSVNSDMKAQTLSVEGTIDPPKLVEYIHKKVHKYTEIYNKKPEKNDVSKESAKKMDVKVVETKQITVLGEDKKVELKIKEMADVPYFIHYVYGPQLFSDENPNACTIM
ncbi:hypothetical protein GIB67_032474 [Kingdonia uniflora]|uniref:HMA domain-containing protein n=1 Tax=Kingdonia uniflora TaxID=39325 RepID=A0A7J7L7P6_9MAGN|nr:hypothetical protein GIB67_032474 [Kingdonia uniflora]